MLQFIKIGQQFSTRVDVLSPEFVKELEKLQVNDTGGSRGWMGGLGGDVGSHQHMYWITLLQHMS
mgnify:CR=1 FL=1